MISSLIQMRNAQANMAKPLERNRNEKNHFFQYVHDCVVLEMRMYVTVSKEGSIYARFLNKIHMYAFVYNKTSV